MPQRSSFGQSIAISGNQALLSIGDQWDNGLGTGPRAAPLNPGQSRSGAVYVYRYKNDRWYLYNVVKPNYHPDRAPYVTFGNDVELSATGIAMIVGEWGESSDAPRVSPAAGRTSMRLAPERSFCIDEMGSGPVS